jgi:hypothetical protein
MPRRPRHPTRCSRIQAPSALPINLAPVTDRHHEHDEAVILDRSDDAIVADAVAPQFLEIGRERMAEPARIVRGRDAFAQIAQEAKGQDALTELLVVCVVIDRGLIQ